MDTAGPWVAAVTALAVAVLSGVLTLVNTRRVAEINDRLARRRSAEEAQREYEYEALKRLYHECQPILFQARQMAHATIRRVVSLTRTARRDQLKWISQRGGYYRLSTLYYMLAPTTTSVILQRQLTSVDLGLDRRLHRQFEIVQLIHRSFADEFSLVGPGEKYDPDRADPEEPDRDELLARQPAVYARQGFYRGTLERIAEALVTEQGGRPRCVSFGEFLDEWHKEDGRLAKVVPDIEEVFADLHPTDRPVLWRVLLVQYFLARALLASPERPQESSSRESEQASIAQEDYEHLNWHENDDDDKGGYGDVLDSIEVATGYVDAALARLDRQLGSAAV